jgi:hypothetical protein
MAQTQSPTKEGYVEAVKLLTGAVATAVKSIVLIETSVTVNEDQTYAGITKVTKSGLSIADGTVSIVQTTVAGDTAQVTHQFTAGESASILGFGVCNDDNDVLYMLCGFAAAQALESGDLLTCTGKIQVKLGS